MWFGATDGRGGFGMESAGTSGRQMLEIIQEVRTAANSTRELSYILTSTGFDLELLEDLSAEHFDAFAVLERQISGAYRD